MTELSFLLLPDVCRCRAVCKQWNQLILSGKFAALHGRHAWQRRGSSLIAMQLRQLGASRREEDGEVWCCFGLSDLQVLLIVEGTSHKIFLLNHNFDMFNHPRLPREERPRLQFDPFLHVYDSATSEWTSIQNNSWIGCGGRRHIHSLVMYRGFLYALFLGYQAGADALVWKLQRFGLTLESWDYGDVYPHGFFAPSLVASDDSLFLAEYMRFL